MSGQRYRAMVMPPTRLNVALASSNATASADSAVNDAGDCGYVAQSSARTLLYASHAIDGLPSTAWQAAGVGGGCCAQCACASSPWLSVAFGAPADVQSLRMTISRTGQGGWPFAPSIAADEAALSGWVLDVLSSTGAVRYSATVAASAAVTTSDTAAYWTWTLPAGACAA